MSEKAYPLAWPAGWPRTKAELRERGLFKMTLAQALARLEYHLRLMGAKDLVVSSNCALGASNPKDSGVCAYFDYDGLHLAIPCDRWLRVEANVNAIALTVEAMRGMERWGAKNMIKAAFSGFQALPAPGSSSAGWRSVLGFAPDAPVDREVLDHAFRKLRSKHHPDRPGGDGAKFHAVQIAYDQASAEIGSP